MKSVVRNWRDPTHHRKVKKKAYKLGEIVFLMGGVGEEHSTNNDCARKRSLWEGSFASFMFVERVRVRECHAD